MKDEQKDIQTPVEQFSGRTGEKKTSTETKHIKVGRHGAEMIMTSDPKKQERMLNQVPLPVGMETPVTMEARVELVSRIISDALGIAIPEGQVPTRIGFNISTDTERRVLFGFLKLLTDTNYRGTYQVPNSQVIKQEFGDKEKPVETLTKGTKTRTGTEIGGAYENIPSTPVVRITRDNIMRASGLDPESGSDRRDFAQAFSALTIRQNFLMWTRIATDEKGRVVKDRNGKTKFELVSTFSPVLNVNFVSDPTTKKLEYYEISPAPVFLDQISKEYGGPNGGYFLLIPEGAYQEVSEAYHKRFPSRRGMIPSVIQALCFWFRLKVQERQNDERNPLSRKKVSNQIRISYFDLCRELDFGEKTIRNNRKRISQTIEDGISVSLDLGYLTGASFDAVSDDYIFDLNLDYYPSRYKQEDSPEEVPEEAPETRKSVL